MGGVIDSLFGGGGSAAAEAMQRQLEQGLRQRQMYGQQADQALNPFAQGGDPLALQRYKSEVNRQLHPIDFMNQILSQYQQSPFAKSQIEEGTRALEHSASAGGLLHSSDTARAIQENAQRLSSEDMQRFLQNALGIYGQGFGGLGGLEQQGYGASGALAQQRTGLGQDIANIYSNIGQTQAAGKMAQGQGMQNLFGTILGGLAGGFGGIPGIKGGLGGALSGLGGIYKYPGLTGGNKSSGGTV